ncbi:MAG: FISUMP domain-containing protein [Thermoflexibacteraceae bacterium]
METTIRNILVATTLLVGLGGASSTPCLQDVSQMTDGRDGMTYKTVRIRGKEWLAENLMYDMPNSYFYQNQKLKSKGRLYTWEAAKKACPEGWHLPTDEEWQELEVALGMSAEEAKDIGYRGTEQGKQLKVKGSSGMNLPLGGFRHTDGSFGGSGENGYYWTATADPHTAGTAFRRSVNAAEDKVYRTNHEVTYAYSCRCVKDE